MIREGSKNVSASAISSFSLVDKVTLSDYKKKLNDEILSPFHLKSSLYWRRVKLYSRTPPTRFDRAQSPRPSMLGVERREPCAWENIGSSEISWAIQRSHGRALSCRRGEPVGIGEKKLDSLVRSLQAEITLFASFGFTQQFGC